MSYQPVGMNVKPRWITTQGFHAVSARPM